MYSLCTGKTANATKNCTPHRGTTVQFVNLYNEGTKMPLQYIILNARVQLYKFQVYQREVSVQAHQIN